MSLSRTIKFHKVKKEVKKTTPRIQIIQEDDEMLDQLINEKISDLEIMYRKKTIKQKEDFDREIKRITEEYEIEREYNRLHSTIEPETIKIIPKVIEKEQEIIQDKVETTHVKFSEEVEKISIAKPKTVKNDLKKIKEKIKQKQ